MKTEDYFMLIQEKINKKTDEELYILHQEEEGKINKNFKLNKNENSESKN